MMNNLKRIMLVVSEGSVWSLFGIMIAWLCLPNQITIHETGLFTNDFGRRLDGTCSGWTTSLAVWHVIGDMLTFWTYITITIILIRLHPIVKRVRYSTITVALMGMFITTCGITHLLEAYATFNPVYYLTAIFKIISALFGIFAMIFIAYGLISAFAIIKHERSIQEKQLHELKEKLKCGKQ